MKLSVITVTYQSREYIDELIQSVSLGASDLEHIIVDNGSQDGTVEAIQEGYGERVKLIANRENRGFAIANNQGLEIATGKYILFLNPDMQVKIGSLDRMVEWMEARGEVGIGGCRLLDLGGAPHEALRPRRFPNLQTNLLFFLGLDRFFKRGYFERFHYAGFQDDQEQEVDTIRGAFMLIPRKILEMLGWGFDPRYFLLFEDVDLCREVKKLGYRVVYTPVISCIDCYHRSFAQLPHPWRYRKLAESALIYTAKWGNWAEVTVLFLAVCLGYLVRIKKWGVKPSLRELGLIR